MSTEPNLNPVDPVDPIEPQDPVDPANPANPTDPEPGPGGPKMFDEGYVKKLREESKSRRIDNEGLRAQIKELEEKMNLIEEKDMSEQEKLKRREKELNDKLLAAEKKAKRLEVRDAVRAGGIKNDAVDLVAARFDGEDTNDLDEHLKELKTKLPELFADHVKQEPTPTAGGSPGVQPMAGSKEKRIADLEKVVTDKRTPEMERLLAVQELQDLREATK